MELSEATIAVYLKQLSGFPEDKLEYAFNRTIQEWSKASTMPPLNFILTRCTEYSAERRDERARTKEILERGAKPPDWEPVSHEQVIAWREEGKQRAIQQLAEIRKAAKELNPGFRQKP